MWSSSCAPASSSRAGRPATDFPGGASPPGGVVSSVEGCLHAPSSRLASRSRALSVKQKPATPSGCSWLLTSVGLWCRPSCVRGAVSQNRGADDHAGSRCVRHRRRVVDRSAGSRARQAPADSKTRSISPPDVNPFRNASSSRMRSSSASPITSAFERQISRQMFAGLDASRVASNSPRPVKARPRSQIGRAHV